MGSLTLMLLFPGAIFFSFIYTEPLFLVLAVVFVLGLDHGRYGWVVLAGVLLPLTRAVGVFCLAPLVWHLWTQRKPARLWLTLLAPAVGYAAYFALMHTLTGNAFEGFDAQRHYPNQPSIRNIVDVEGFAQAFVAVGSWHGMVDSAIDRVLFVVFLATLPAIWRLDRAWFWYALGTGLVPALSNWFFSYNRFLMMCFPVFVVLARWLDGDENRWIRRYYWALLGAVQVVFLWRHVNHHWAG